MQQSNSFLQSMAHHSEGAAAAGNLHSGADGHNPRRKRGSSSVIKCLDDRKTNLHECSTKELIRVHERWYVNMSEKHGGQ